MTKLPSFLKKYFWDVDFNRLNLEKNAFYIIERLLEAGDAKTIRWLLKTFKNDLIKKAVMTRRGLSPKTANFWSHILGIDPQKIVCLQTPYLKMRQTHWPY